MWSAGNMEIGGSWPAGSHVGLKGEWFQSTPLAHCCSLTQYTCYKPSISSGASSTIDTLRRIGSWPEPIGPPFLIPTAFTPTLQRTLPSTVQVQRSTPSILWVTSSATILRPSLQTPQPVCSNPPKQVRYCTNRVTVSGTPHQFLKMLGRRRAWILLRT